MAETAHETADNDATGPHAATLEELAADPERVANAADAGPVRIERPDGAPLVLLTAAEFERLNEHLPRAVLAEELSAEEVEWMRAQQIPAECAAFDDEVPEGWLDARR